MPKLLAARRRWLPISLAAVVSAWALVPPAGDEVIVPAIPAAPNVVSANDSLALPADLPKRPPLRQAAADPFAPRHSAAPASSPEEREEAPEPQAPPVPYRIAGSIRYDNKLRVLLAAGDRVYEAKVGEILDGVYRVDAATPEAVTLLYTPLGIEQQLAVTASASAAGASAQFGLQTAAARTVVEQVPPPQKLQGPHARAPFPRGSPLARQ